MWKQQDKIGKNYEYVFGLFEHLFGLIWTDLDINAEVMIRSESFLGSGSMGPPNKI